MKTVRQHLVQPAISALLILVSAVCLLKYLAWSAVFSGAYGLPSQAEAVGLARRWGLAYLSAGLLAESAGIINLIVYIKLDGNELSGMLRGVGRVIVAIVIAVLGTMSVALFLAWIGKLSAHG